MNCFMHEFKLIFIAPLSFPAVSSIKARAVCNASFGEFNRNSGKRLFLCINTIHMMVSWL